jgi:hypothetical protein
VHMGAGRGMAIGSSGARYAFRQGQGEAIAGLAVSGSEVTSGNIGKF